MTYELQISRHDQSPLTFSIQLLERGTAGAGDNTKHTDVIEFSPEADSITVPINITRDDQAEELLIRMIPASSVSSDSIEPTTISENDGGT